MSLSPDALNELVDKYRALVELRHRLPKAAERERRPSDPGERRGLRELAHAFPGALRELERLPTAELESRLAAVVAAQAGAPPEPWMAWIHAYHALMRVALALR